MKNIAYRDRNNLAPSGAVKVYGSPAINQRPRWTRFFDALRELRGTGNINVYMVRGRKVRRIFTRSINGQVRP